MARKTRSPPSTKVRVAQGGVGSLKHEKHHLNAYRSAQVVTLFIFNTINILPFIRKKLENPAPVYLDVVLFTKKNMMTDFESPWKLRLFFFSPT